MHPNLECQGSCKIRPDLQQHQIKVHRTSRESEIDLEWFFFRAQKKAWMNQIGAWKNACVMDLLDKGTRKKIKSKSEQKVYKIRDPE